MAILSRVERAHKHQNWILSSVDRRVSAPLLPGSSGKHEGKKESWQKQCDAQDNAGSWHVTLMHITQRNTAANHASAFMAIQHPTGQLTLQNCSGVV